MINVFGRSWAAGLVLGRRSGFKWTNMDQHRAKRIPKGQMEPDAPKIVFEGEEVCQKEINETKNTMFGKGRHRDVNSHSNYLARIACFLELC